jgi:2,3-dihydroxybenzoate-AMP ligase
MTHTCNPLPEQPQLLLRDCPTWPLPYRNRYCQAGYWRGQTFGQLLRQQAQQHGERLAIVSESQRWSYRELDERADRLAAGFKQLGIQAGDRVIVQLPNIPEFFAVCFALFRLGVLPILTLPAHRQIEIRSFCTHAEAVAYIIADREGDFDYRQLAREILAQTQSLQHVIVVGEFQEFIALNQLELEPQTLTEPTASDIAFFQLSGGSTGVPKLIPRTHDDYLYSVRASAEICALNANSVYLVALPVAHNFPLSSPGSLGTLYAGGQVVLTRNPSPDKAFDLIAREQVTITAVVPSLAIVWLEAAATRNSDLSSLQLLQVGGAKLTVEVAKRLATTFNGRLQQVFGMSEGLVCYTRLDDPQDLVLQTQGRPISPDDEIRVVDDRDQAVALGEIGHLLTRGPYTIRGYYRAPEQNAAAFTEEGFYRTGDLVCLTPTGHLIVEGRSKEQINRGGEKITSEEVENHLFAHPQILNAVVVAMPDDYLGERTCAFLIPHPISAGESHAREASAPNAMQLRRFLRTRGLADYKIPDRFEWVSSLPLTAAGKVDRKILRDQLSRPKG